MNRSNKSEIKKRVLHDFTAMLERHIMICGHLEMEEQRPAEKGVNK